MKVCFFQLKHREVYSSATQLILKSERTKTLTEKGLQKPFGSRFIIWQTTSFLPVTLRNETHANKMLKFSSKLVFVSETNAVWSLIESETFVENFYCAT